MVNNLKNVSLALTFLLFAPMEALADSENTGYYHHGMVGEGFMGSVMMIFMLIVIVAFIFFILKAMGVISSYSDKKNEETAIDILKKRYASGEISKEEFDKMLQDL